MMNSKYNTLFEPLSFRSGVTLKNRIVLAPMTTVSSHEDGTVTDAEVDYYNRRTGGVGMAVTACVYVTRNGKGWPGEFGADSDEMIPSLRRLASAIQSQGAKAILQIFHGGRSCLPQAVPDNDLVSPSSVAEEKEGARVPRELSVAEIEGIIHDFGEATRRAVQAGYDGVEIHGANGYLLQQFYSASSNRRNDSWGGTLEKRMAFPLAVVDAVKKAADKAVKPFIVGYRLSPEEPGEHGLTMEDTFILVEALIKKDLDYLHVSLNDFWSRPHRGIDDSKTRMEWLLERYAEQIPFIGVGNIKTAEEALLAKQTGVQLLALGRELIIDPDWVQKVEQGHVETIHTTLTEQDQKRLVIPDPLWGLVMNVEGWFPVVK